MKIKSFIIINNSGVEFIQLKSKLCKKIISAKGPKCMLFQVVKSFDILGDMPYLGHLQLISFTLEIGLSIMELQCPEFLIMRTFQLHTSTLMLLPGKLLYHRYNTK